jgi:hypothetical protein
VGLEDLQSFEVEHPTIRRLAHSTTIGTWVSIVPYTSLVSHSNAHAARRHLFGWRELFQFLIQLPVEAVGKSVHQMSSFFLHITNKHHFTTKAGIAPSTGAQPDYPYPTILLHSLAAAFILSSVKPCIITPSSYRNRKSQTTQRSRFSLPGCCRDLFDIT